MFCLFWSLAVLEAIETYRNHIRSLESDIEEIEKQEREEKEFRLVENKINRVQKKLENEEELRPQRTWFQTKQERLQEIGICLLVKNHDI